MNVSHVEESSNSTNSIGTEQMVEILDFLKMGGDKLQLSPNEEVTLLLGITGSGKSTFAQWIAGDPNTLHSKEVEEDSGEFVIVDNDGRISSNSTVLSKTVFPDLIKDRTTGSIFYDCPGFSDTRSAAHEIGATYFIKKILDSAKAVKLVFVVSHHSVRKGVDRKDFVLLIKHAVDFIKDVGKYKDSIALVVTKVENTHVLVGEAAVLVSDKKIIKSIASFIKGVKHDLAENPELLQSGHSRANDFLDALLHKENEDYKNIGIFRRPNKAGVLTESKLLQEGKKNLQRMIYGNIFFREIDTNDFGYTISSDSKMYINELINEINKNIIKELNGLGKEIEEYCTEKEGQIFETEKLVQTFQELHLGFGELQTLAINDLITFQQYITHIERIIAEHNISVSNIYYKNIKKEENYIDFLYFVKGQSIRTAGSAPLAKGLEKLCEYVTGSWKWYGLLIDLYSKLSQYEIQRKKNEYMNEMPALEYPKTGITKFTEDTYLGQLIEEAFKHYEGIPLNMPKLNLFNKTLELTLNYNVETTCVGDNKLLVKGQFLILSDAMNYKCDGEIKVIQLFALEKVFIDTSLDLTGKEVQLAIAAPEWEVVGSPKITLDGRSGAAHYQNKASSGSNDGSDGDDGLPGHPGGPAGSFLGIGKHFINDNFLEISANGGSGGRGQDGGDGAYGEDANASWDGEMAFLLPLGLYNKANYYIKGHNGGEGGNGGAGGYGGISGRVYMHMVGYRSPANVKISMVNGSEGGFGSGGYGGLGGRHGEYTWENYIIFITDRYIQHLNERAPSGRSGHSGSNHWFIEKTWLVENELNPDNIITDYIYYLNEQSSGQIKETYFRSFSQEISEDFNNDAVLYRKKRYVTISNYSESTRGNRINSTGALLKSTIQKMTDSEDLSSNHHQSIPSTINPNYQRDHKISRKSSGISEDNASDFEHLSNSEYQPKYGRQLLQDDDLLPISSGANSFNKNSFLNTIFNMAIGGIISFKPWTFFDNGNKFSLNEEKLRLDRSDCGVLPLASISPEMALPSQSTDANIDELYPLMHTHSNLLLWDLVIKVLTGKNAPHTCEKKGGRQETADFASQLAYSYYAPKNYVNNREMSP